MRLYTTLTTTCVLQGDIIWHDVRSSTLSVLKLSVATDLCHLIFFLSLTRYFVRVLPRREEAVGWLPAVKTRQQWLRGAAAATDVELLWGWRG